MSVLHAPTYEWTVEEYEKLNTAGIFTGSDRVELLRGNIIVMSPVGYRHSTAVSRLVKFFIKRANDRYELRCQDPFVLDPHSEPEPDISLFDPVVDQQKRLPSADQVFLLIEVADSTLRYDREDKRPAYARRGIAEYWVLNLQANELEIFRDPVDEGYGDTRVLGPEEIASPLAFPDIRLRVGDFLP